MFEELGCFKVKLLILVQTMHYIYSIKKNLVVHIYLLQKSIINTAKMSV